MIERINIVLLCSLLVIIPACSQSEAVNTGEQSKLYLGAYYFDGWTSLNNIHINQKLIDSFPEREPIWGWVTSRQEVIDEQINLAADAGISFFSFCWYYPQYTSYDKEPLNQALKYYLNSPVKSRLKFNIMVANHDGFIIGPQEWKTVAYYWLNLFEDPNYLRVDNKPLLIFFSAESLIKSFGSAEVVRQRLDSLRTVAQDAGFNGLNLGVCVEPNQNSIQTATQCGFDILTGYNYHSVGFVDGKKVIPIDSLIRGSYKAWNEFITSPLPYIPVVTLNWDPRPWSDSFNSLRKSPRYTGYSAESIYRSILNLRNWSENNAANMTSDKLALIYAWNEYGEGAWLTPSKGIEENLMQAEQYKELLSGIKKGLQSN